MGRVAVDDRGRSWTADETSLGDPSPTSKVSDTAR